MEDREKLLERLRDLCARAEHCSADIYQKAMKALDWDAAASREVADALVDEGFVDDFRYARAFARDKAQLTGWGPVKISYFLTGKGIAKADVARALAEIDADKASAKMESLLRAKYRAVRGEADAKLRLLKYALSRGYEYSAVESLVNDIVAGN